MNLFKRILFATLSLVLVAFGASLSIKAAVGLGAWDALSKSLSTLINIKVGTFAMILNGSCVVSQMILMGKKFNISRILQFGVAILLGVFVNFFYYDLFSSLVFTSYWVRIVVFTLATTIISFGVSTVMVVNVVTFPLEALCMIIDEKKGWGFSKIRQAFDVISIILSIAISLIFAQAFDVREGTVIGMFIFAPLLGIFMPRIEPTLKRLNLTK